MADTDFADYMKPEWLADDSSVSAVWIAAFEMFTVTEEQIRTATHTVKALDARLTLGFGPLDYFDMSGLQVQLNPGAGPTFYGDPEDLETPAVAHLVIAFPMPGGVDDPDQDEADRYESAVIGLVVAFLGRNAAARKLFDMCLDITGAFSVFGRIDNPFRHGRPNLADDALLEIEAASDALSDLSPHDQDRLRLSLRWFGQSLREEEDQDAFIKLWVALEVLAMPDATNVKPLNLSLADAYDMPFDEVTRRFQVGRIHGLRSDMLHEGKSSLHFPLISDYAHALYIDLLRHMVGLAHIGVSLAFMEKDGAGMWKRLEELRSQG